MSYKPNIPLVTDFIAVSQKQMLSNYAAIHQAWLVDHVALTSEDNVGMHTDLTLRPQGSDPTTSSTQCALYNKLVSSVPQLFFRPQSNGTPIQMSNSNLSTIQTGADPDEQQSFLAGPFTIFMGYVRACPNNQLVTLSAATNLFYVGLSTYLLVVGQGGPQNLNTAAPVNISGNQFTIRYPTTILAAPNQTKFPTIYYTAIGI